MNLTPAFDQRIGRGIRVRLFGKPTDWRGHEATKYFLENVPEKSQMVGDIFAPTLSNSRIIADSDPMDDGWSKTTVSDLNLYHNVECDAVSLLGPGAVIMKTGDCPILILQNNKSPDTVTVVHCGRENLFDRKSLEGPGLLMDREVSIVTRACWQGSQDYKAEFTAWIGLGIKPEFFQHDPKHPIHGTYNQKLLRFLDRCSVADNCFWGKRSDGFLNLQAIIADKLVVDKKVPFNNITFGDFCPYTNNEVAWSNRRREPQRNLVYIEVS